MKRTDLESPSRRRWLGVLGALPTACVPDLYRPPQCYVGSAADPSCRELVWSYNNMDYTRSTVLRPRDLADLQRILREMPHQGRRVSFRGGGAALDRQSLNDDTVILLDNPSFQQVWVYPDAACGPSLTVGGGATWQQVLDHTVPLGLVPYCMPSASYIRVGGSIAANTFSRMAARWGREERYLTQFTLVGADGRLYDCHAGQPVGSLERQLFLAVPGAQGYLGAVTSAQYKLRRVGPPGSPMCIKTESRVVELGTTVAGNPVVETFLGDLRNSKSYFPDASPACGSGVEYDPPACGNGVEDDNPSLYDGIFGTVWWARDPRRTMRGLIAHVKYLPQASAGRTGLLNRRDGFLRVFGEFGFVEPGGEASIQDVNFYLVGRHQESYDDVDNFTFFQDADRRARNFAAPRWRMTAVEQAFCLSPDVVQEFLDRLDRHVREVQHYPALVDLLYAPKDLREHPLSATRCDRVVVVTVAYLDRNGERWQCTQEMYRTLSGYCAALGGKIYLGKTVEAEVDALNAMYATGVRELREIKRVVDPDNLITNGFWDRNLGCLTP